jgi:hypothetical protein
MGCCDSRLLPRRVTARVVLTCSFSHSACGRMLWRPTCLVARLSLTPVCCVAQPMCAFFGGIAAQEVVKVCSKFTPFKQWLHFDAFEVLPTELPTEPLPLPSRYSHQISVFGEGVHDALTRQSTFVVGTGALGCELLKNFALIGLATAGGSSVHCTDNDRIEVRPRLVSCMRACLSVCVPVCQSACLLH